VLDVPLVEGVTEHIALQLVDFRVDGFADRLVVLGNEIQQRIEHEVFAVLQQQRARLAALANVAVGGRVAVARGNDVAVAGEDMGFDELQFALRAHRRISDDEQRIAEGLQLRSAVLFQGILDGQFVQLELALQVGQLVGVGFFQADPDKVAGFGGPGSAFVEADIRDFLSAAVDGGSNNSTHGSGSLLLINGAVTDLVQLSLQCSIRVTGRARVRRQIKARTRRAFGVAQLQAACSCRSMLAMHSRICSRHWAISSGMSSRVSPAVGMAGSERIRTLPAFQRLRRMCLM